MTAAGTPWFVLAPPPPQFPGVHLECQDDPEAWFPPAGWIPHEVQAACVACPVRQQCLEWALEAARVSDGAGPDGGVWGGYSHEDVKRLVRGEQTRTRVVPAPGVVRDPAVLPRPRCEHDPDLFYLSGQRWRCRECESASARARRARLRDAA